MSVQVRSLALTATVVNVFCTPRVDRVIIAQLAATVLIAAVALSWSGAPAAISIAAGGLSSALPNACFAMLAFRCHGADNANRIVRNFAVGEVSKIGLTAMLLALSFTLITGLQELVLLFGFMLVHLAGVMGSAVVFHAPRPDQGNGQTHAG